MHGVVLTSNAFAVANADVASSLQALNLLVQIRLAATALPSQAMADGATSDAGLLGDAPNTP